MIAKWKCSRKMRREGLRRTSPSCQNFETHRIPALFLCTPRFDFGLRPPAKAALSCAAKWLSKDKARSVSRPPWRSCRELLRKPQTLSWRTASSTRPCSDLFCGHHQWFLASRGSRSRHFNNESFKVLLWSVDYWLIWQLFRWFIPRSSGFNSTRKSLRDQFADFLSL